MFFETSAKTALNVEEAFLTTAGIIAKNIEKGEYDLTNEVIQIIFIFFRVLVSNLAMLSPLIYRNKQIRIIKRKRQELD